MAAGLLAAVAPGRPASARALPAHVAAADAPRAAENARNEPTAPLGAPSPSPSTAIVAVIRPAAGDQVLEEASLRIRSELDAVGTSNRLVDCAASGAADAATCGESASAARIALGREEGIATIQVMATLPDGLELRRHVRVPPEAGGGDPSVLAVRAVELLRDIYLDIPRVAHRSPKAMPVARAAATKEAGPSSGGGNTIAGRAFLGAAVLQGRWGLGAAAAPAFGFGVSFSRLALLATVAGPFHKVVGSWADGSADTWQTLGIAELRYEIGLRWVRPYATAGFGLFSLRVQGHPEMVSPMNAAITGSNVAPLVAVGAGLLVRVVSWVGLTLDVQEIVTWPVLDVTPGGTVIGRAGGPSDRVQLGLVLMRP